ncbi:tRNA(adenine34) deaminase [Pseudobacteriovorax antillogorgiicola]|uniref:tRNA-specific adenosine deaminase n=2 Tax=Pseudobacteriovorax antillogorgiicola TaxID=1513793 RepID=A0A1Y6B2E6_9BACT|nr:tRNA(adenine34) deaminase [Pseudobacteriovorax antillogorgiicola]SME88013.1 tRNA(adenine34) deaminase [Pseudobacteriovorax antillogorgiicola]
MALALSLARSAAMIDEVPVGAVITFQDRLLCTGLNLRETLQDPTAHAELLAIKKAAKLLGTWRLVDCDLFVTLEPCVMCSGAIFQSRFRRVVYGTADPKGGALGSLYSIHQDERLNHAFPVEHGLFADECSQVLKDFFRRKRRPKQKDD